MVYIQLLGQLLKYASGMVGLVGTYFIIFYYNRYFLYEKVRSRGILTQGVVTAWNEGSEFINGFVFGGKAPIVEFANDNGHYRHISRTFQSPSPYKIGQIVNVWVLSEKSGTELALEDDKPNEKLKKLLVIGITLCLLSYPFILYSVLKFYFL